MEGRKKTYYEVLGITAAAPQEIVSAVYRAWMKAMKAHPDLGGDEEFAKALNEAYDILKDPERRMEYDEKLKRETKASHEAGRRAPRTRVDAVIAICTSIKGSWQDANVVDASALGLRIKTREVLEAGQHLAIAFPGSCAMAAEAKVAWATHLKDGGTFRVEAGVEFFSPIPNILHRLGNKT